MSDSYSENELQHYLEYGYVVIENAMEQVGLSNATASFEKVQNLTELAWKNMVASGVIKGGYGHGPNAHTMNNIHKYDDLWLELAMNPRIVPLLKRIVGIDVQVMGNGLPLPSCRYGGSYFLAPGLAGLDTSGTYP